MATGASTLKSQSSGEYMARTTYKEKSNNLSMSLKSNESNSDNKVPQVPSAQRKMKSTNMKRRASPKIETFVPEKKHNFAIDFYGKTNVEAEKNMNKEPCSNDVYAQQISAGNTRHSI